MIRYHRVHTCKGMARDEAMAMSRQGAFVHLQWDDNKGWSVVTFYPNGEVAEYELEPGEHCYTAFDKILQQHG